MLGFFAIEVDEALLSIAKVAVFDLAVVFGAQDVEAGVVGGGGALFAKKCIG